MAAILFSLYLALTPYSGCLGDPCDKDWDCCDGFICEDNICAEA